MTLSLSRYGSRSAVPARVLDRASATPPRGAPRPAPSSFASWSGARLSSCPAISTATESACSCCVSTDFQTSRRRATFCGEAPGLDSGIGGARPTGGRGSATPGAWRARRSGGRPRTAGRCPRTGSPAQPVARPRPDLLAAQGADPLARIRAARIPEGRSFAAAAVAFSRAAASPLGPGGSGGRRRRRSRARHLPPRARSAPERGRPGRSPSPSLAHARSSANVARGMRAIARWSHTYGMTDDVMPTPSRRRAHGIEQRRETPASPSGVIATAAMSIAAARRSRPPSSRSRETAWPSTMYRANRPQLTNAKTKPIGSTASWTSARRDARDRCDRARRVSPCARAGAARAITQELDRADGAERQAGDGHVEARIHRGEDEPSATRRRAAVGAKRRHGRRHGAKTGAALAMRSQATPSTGSGKSSTANAGPEVVEDGADDEVRVGDRLGARPTMRYVCKPIAYAPVRSEAIGLPCVPNTGLDCCSTTKPSNHRGAAGGRAASMAELGRRVNLSPPAVAERVQRLEREGVITGYQPPSTRRRSGTASPPSSASHPPTRARAHPSGRTRDARGGRVPPHHGRGLLFPQAPPRAIDDLEDVLDRFTPYGRTTTSIIHSSPVDRRPLPLEP